VPVPQNVWDRLIRSIEKGEIVPVIGPELSIVADGDRQVPLYRLIAERLADTHGLPKSQWREGAELNDAVCSCLDDKPGAVNDLYEEIESILESLKPTPPEPLRKLAGISGFNLFVTTAMDNLLFAALREARPLDRPPPLQIAYAPNQTGAELRDLPVPEAGAAVPAVVFHLFGKYSTLPTFAIHDEDYLEFVHQIETSSGPKRLLLELQSRHLMFIGCEFSDWLNRFLIRIANPGRLRTDRLRREYVASRESTQEAAFNRFLARFSKPTQVLGITGAEFVDELAARWDACHPPTSATPGGAPTGVEARAPSPRGAIFISYASEDFAAADNLRAEVARMSGDDVCWFDKRALKPGERWESEIRNTIGSSVQLFLAVISRNTEMRKTGVVLQEWRLAVAAQQRQSFTNHSFIVPVVVDPDFQGRAGSYQNIPPEFRDLHFGRAPQGVPDDSLRSLLQEQIRRMPRER